jgi:hypothetical protein
VGRLPHGPRRGSEDARRLLLGQTSTADDWVDLLDARFERRGAYLIEHAV